MKLTFLGTGAGEGYPGLWCECPHCDYARKHGGKNVRTNSCAVLDESLLIDIGPGCFDNAARFGVNLCHVTSLLITHPHEDHLYPQHLTWRRTDEGNLGLPYAVRVLPLSPNSRCTAERLPKSCSRRSVNSWKARGCALSGSRKG